MKTRVIKLKEIADIIMGQSPKSKYYNHDGKGIEFLQGTKTFGENVPYFDTFTTNYNRLSKVGDILFSVRAPVGKVNIADRDIAIGRGIAAIRAKSEVDKMYLYYWFKRFLRRIESSTSGTVFQSINKKDLENISMEIPDSLHVQKRVGNLLFSIDNKIQNNNEINDNLFELSSLLFQKLIDKSTKRTRLCEISNIQNGYAFKSAEYVKKSNGILILRTKNIKNNILLKNDVKYTSKNNFEKYNRFSFELYDSVIVMVGASIGKTGFITQNVLPSLQNQNMWRFRSNNNIIPGLYIYEIVNYINNKVKNSTSGSARSFYKKKLFLDKEVPIIEKNNYIIFNKIENKINELANENNVLGKVKLNLMKNLI